MNDKNTVKLGELSQIFKGVPKFSISNSSCEMIQWTNIKNWLDGNDLETQISGMVEKNYNNVIPFMKKGDIIISVFTGEVLYIDADIEEQYLYGQSVFVIRVDEKVISSKYIYILLNSKKYRDATLLSQFGYSRKVRKTDLEILPIPLIDEEKRKKNIEEYDELEDKYMKCQKELLDVRRNMTKFFDDFDVL